MDLRVTDSLESLQVERLAEPYEFEAGSNVRSGWRFLPRTAEHAARLLHWAQENHRQVALNATDALALSQPLWLDVSAMSAIRQYAVDDFIIQVETGMTIDRLQQLLGENEQALPLQYPDGMKLIDILAEDKPALETGLHGYPRDYVLKAELATPDGQVTVSGADVVKNVTGYDLAKLYVGGRHAFGILTAVTLKLSALPARRQPWLYTLDSASAAFALSETLLAQPLPLTLCELYRKDGRWYILLEISGDSTVLDECRMVLLLLSDYQAQALDAETGRILRQRLLSWPVSETVLEAALPFGQWPALAEALLKLSWADDVSIQIRPAAGLVYLVSERFAEEQIQWLLETVRVLDGFIQPVQVSSAQGNAPTSLALPEDDLVRRLLKRLKKSYDPKGVLYTPLMPL